MGSTRPGWRPFAVALLALIAVAPALAPRAAYAQAPAVDEARALYDQAQFEQATALLREALTTGRVSGADATAARELLARCLVRTGNRLEARQAFKALLYRNPAYRPPAGIPPDEVEVFVLARSEYDAEQIEAGRRVPASLAFHYGVGSGANEDLAEIAVAGGGDKQFDVDESFGGAVRFPISPRWSLEIEMQRFRAANADTFPGDNRAVYEVSALPLSLSAYYAAIVNPKWRVNVFGGVGSLLAATSSIRFNFGSVTLQLSDQKNGFYGHAGVEGEYLVTPRFAAWGRALARVANAGDIYSGSELIAYGVAPLKGREVNFSGVGAHVGLRAYIGY
jgi:tetratricopeptide (TPR) repeat protein